MSLKLWTSILPNVSTLNRIYYETEIWAFLEILGWEYQFSQNNVKCGVEPKQHNWYFEVEVDVTFSWTYFNAYTYLN